MMQSSAYATTVQSVRDLDRLPKFKCFRCVPVRTAALAHGFYTLFMQMLFASVLLLVLLHPEKFFQNYQSHDESTITIEFFDNAKTQDLIVAPGSDPMDPNSPRVQMEPLRRARGVNTGEPFDSDENDESYGKITFIKEEKASPNYVVWPMNNMRSMTKRDAQLGLIFSLSLIVTTIFMVHGVLYHRALYILPYFSYLMFDFIIACLYTLGHSRWTAELEQIAEKSQYKLSDGQVQLFMLLVLVSCVFLLFFKAYMIGVFWSTYQYSIIRQCLRRRVELDILRPRADSKNSNMNLLPPKYEEAQGMPTTNEQPPPRYEDAASPRIQDV